MTAVTSLLADHAAFQLDSVDRIFVAGYVPELRQPGPPVPSTTRSMSHRASRSP